MDLISSAILGVVQGLTEFLPVSSSGHLVIGQQLLGFKEPDLLFDVSVHVGTLLAVVWVFAEDIWDMARGALPGKAGSQDGRRLLILVIAGSIPTAIMGLLLKDAFERLFASPKAVGIALLITGCLLMATRLAPAAKVGLAKMKVWRALVIGVAQGVAITPGISRSGSTICTALLLGVDRELAARFSFVLSLPAILGALFLELHHAPAKAAAAPLPLLVGGATAAISGYVALKLLLKIVKAGRMHLFAYYCWPLGLAVLLFL